MVSVVQNNAGAGWATLMSYNSNRLIEDNTGRFLHQSGQGTTTDENYAWFGTHRQAQALSDRAFARGEEFPFGLARRTNDVALNDDFEQPSTHQATKQKDSEPKSLVLQA